MPRFIAYRTVPGRSLDRVPAPAKRAWMDASPSRFAYRCLPMLIANRAGWSILNGHEFRATWSGGRTCAAVRIEYLAHGDVEGFQQELRDVAAAEPELQEAYAAWCDGRKQFLVAKTLAGPADRSGQGLPWQGDHFRGAAPDGITAPGRQMKPHVRAIKVIQSDSAAPLAEEAEE